MRYYRRLAYRLRRRGLPEARVARVLSEVRDLATASGQPPQAEFGPADAYATTFSKGGSRWPLSRWVIWGARLAGGGFLILNLELRRSGGQTLLPWWAVLGVWLAVLAAGEAACFALDHRLPRAFPRGAVPESRPSPPDESRPAPATGAAPGAGYYRALAFHLRLRQLPEAEVARVLHEVRELSWASGTTPEAEFGPAQDYADQFDRRKQRYGPGLVVFLVCLLAIFVLQVTNMVAGLGIGDRLLPPGPTLLTCAALFVGGAAFAIVHEHRLPRAFRRKAG